MILELSRLRSVNHHYFLEFETLRAKEFSQGLENIRLSSDFRAILMLTRSEDLEKETKNYHSKRWKNREIH